ncbi:MAG: putative DNA binding domain-containing protein [Deltaproteobacteria bacterium]|nr:putative DNA binding domain-containing protein [Deltaproteobacteria bacterium]
MNPKDLAVTMTAFANTEGGVIYLGVTDQRLIHVVAVTPLVLEHNGRLKRSVISAGRVRRN